MRSAVEAVHLPTAIYSPGSRSGPYVHFPCCVIDGVFAAGEDGQVYFAEAATLTPEDLVAVQQQVRARLLRWFARAGLLDQADARDMAGWNHGGGFSLDASVGIDGHDRAGLERLLRNSRPPALCAGAARAGRRRPDRLSLAPAAARWRYPTCGIWASPPPHPKWPRHVGPPLWDQVAKPVPRWVDSPAPVPAFVFDQRLNW